MTDKSTYEKAFEDFKNVIALGVGEAYLYGQRDMLKLHALEGEEFRAMQAKNQTQAIDKITDKLMKALTK